MFARKLHLVLAEGDGEKPVRKAWLDQFFMRNFTGHSAFDDVMVTADGTLEAGFGVRDEEVREKFETWLRGRKMIPGGSRLIVREDDCRDERGWRARRGTCGSSGRDGAGLSEVHVV